MAFERLKKFLDNDSTAHYSEAADRIYVGNDAFFAVIDLRDWGGVPSYPKTDLYREIYEGMTDPDRVEIVTDYFYLKLESNVKSESGLEYLVASGGDKAVAINAKFTRLIPGLSPQLIYDEEEHTHGFRFLIMYSHKLSCHMWIAQVNFPEWALDKIIKTMEKLRGVG